MQQDETAQKPVEVACALIWQKNRFLATQRPEGKPFAQYWELPGGKLEAGETPESALYRELMEELGIEPRHFRLRGTVNHKYTEGDLQVKLFIFEVLAYSGNPDSKENQHLLWIDPSELDILKFLPADREILKDLVAAGPRGQSNS